MKAILKSLVLVVLSLVFIYGMIKFDFLHLNSIKNSYLQHKEDLILVAVFQIFVCFLSGIRYYSLLKIFEIKATFKKAIAATFLGNSLGLWMPGSMAFIELIRIGFMIGTNSKENMSDKSFSNGSEKYDPQLAKTQLSLRSRIATSSIFDRLIGLWSMLLIGVLVLFYMLFFASTLNLGISEIMKLKYVFLAMLFLLFAMSLLPLISKNKILRKILNRVERLFLLFFKLGFMHKILKKLFLEIDSILDAIALGHHKYFKFIFPLILSIICVFVQAYGTNYAAIALQFHIPLFPILATSSILALSTLLPIGFGGIGGVQIIAALALSCFGVKPHEAASAQFLQTVLNLLSISISGVFFVPTILRQLKNRKKRSFS